MTEYTSWLIYWVVLISIWGTMIVEFWKRKTAEINTRWGNLSLMNLNEDEVAKAERKQFSGDEVISEVTGESTKFYKPTTTILKLFLSGLVLLGLLGAMCGSYFLIKMYVDEYGAPNKKYAKIHSLIGGFLNGISITILNLVYSILARLFVQWENHKYDSSFEKSLAYKTIAFKVFYFFFFDLLYIFLLVN